MANRVVNASDTFEQFRLTFNELGDDVGEIASITGASGVIASATDVVEAVVALNNNANAGTFTNITVTGNILNGSGVTLNLPSTSGTISTEGFSIALATALG